MNNNTPSANDNPFASACVDRIRAADGQWELAGGRILLPRVFGFCRGVEHALTMLQRAVSEHSGPGRLVLLGPIIHNPWVNDYFASRGVALLSRDQWPTLDTILTADDTAIIPAFGVPLDVEQALVAIGCKIVNTACGDVRRLWRWSCQAASDGHGIVIYGKANHDETVVTKSRLAAIGGQYVVVSDGSQIETLCKLLAGELPAETFADHFGPDDTNTTSLEPFYQPAQVSQTTMLYNETLHVREQLAAALARRFGPEGGQRLQAEPTVCRATQDRQSAATELCRQPLDVVIVVGGLDSSNTRHLYELARREHPAWFIEDVRGMVDATTINAFDPQLGQARMFDNWLPASRPITVGLLAGASCPEIVVGQVAQRLAKLL
jgi:4-hydroxy-3-methylbut-2-enyl diphosphate reductase